jgi:hypothetical protein
MKNKKVMIIIVVLLVLTILIYLSIPSKINLDVHEIKSITVEVDDYTLNKTIQYKKEFTNIDDINNIVNMLKEISFRKISYQLDISAVGNTGYRLEVKYLNGNIKIITVYFDDTIKIQSNGRYKIQEGTANQIKDELLTILK